MRMLLPESREVDPGDLVDLYDWPEARWVRACMVTTLDGAVAGPDGVSGSLSSATDRMVLSAVRALADAYVVGAATLRSEGYGPVRVRPEYAQRRAGRGQAGAATLVAVSASCRFDWSTARFQDSDVPPLVLTTERSRSADRQAARAAGCEVEVVGEETVEVGRVLDVLAERALTRITVEGGPQLLRQVIGADALDELDLTVAPLLTGSGPPAGPPAVSVAGMRVEQVLEHESFLFTRYVRPGGPR